VRVIEMRTAERDQLSLEERQLIHDDRAPRAS